MAFDINGKVLKEGDRIRLVAMDDDPDPIPVGTTGTVTWVSSIQAGVDWDINRSLNLALDEDKFEIIGES